MVTAIDTKTKKYCGTFCAVNEADVRPHTTLHTSHWYSNLCHTEPRSNWGTDSRVSLLSQKVCIIDFSHWIHVLHRFRVEV